MKKFLNSQEAADALNLSYRYLMSLVRSRQLIPLVVRGRASLFRTADVLSFRDKVKKMRHAASVRAVRFAHKTGLYDDEFSIITRSVSLEDNLRTVDKPEPIRKPAEDFSTGKEILRLAEKQSKKFKAELIEKKLIVSADEICEALGFTRRSLNKALKENRMFYLQQGRRHYYPVFYADGRLSRPVLEDITLVLGDLTGSQKWQFFTRPKNSLFGKTPIEALQEGLVDNVLKSAWGFVER